jgi:hypothetical protein
MAEIFKTFMGSEAVGGGQLFRIGQKIMTLSTLIHLVAG